MACSGNGQDGLDVERYSRMVAEHPQAQLLLVTQRDLDLPRTTRVASMSEAFEVLVSQLMQMAEEEKAGLRRGFAAIYRVEGTEIWSR